MQASICCQFSVLKLTEICQSLCFTQGARKRGATIVTVQHSVTTTVDDCFSDSTKIDRVATVYSMRCKLTIVKVG